MFTGIVEETGVVHNITTKKNLITLSVKAQKVVRGTRVGDSIAIDGACMTVTSINKNVLAFDVMKESLDVTTLGAFKKGQRVNLERALKANARLGGHFVSGHVDAVVAIKKIRTLPNFVEYQFALPKSLKQYFVPKGSVTIDGISLTVGNVAATTFSVYLIPHTLEITTMGEKKVGDKVNIETDLLAKYILSDR